MPTLHQYLHCPYCVRADMTANYLGIEHKKSYLLNDDEATCHKLIGAKMVPILEFDDGTAMGESLDIVEKLIEMAPAGKKLLPKTEPEKYTKYLESVSFEINALLFPRNVMIEQPEFATEEAREYFRKKKEKSLGMSFEEAFDNTEKYKKAVEVALADMPAPPLPAQQMNQLGWNDIFVFPVLRNLTMVKDLAMPDELAQYVAAVAELTDIKLYTVLAK